MLLKLCELGLVEGLTAKLALEEIERNLRAKLPQALPAFRVLLRERVLSIVPTPSTEDLAGHADEAHPKDLPHLVAAIEGACHYLVTHNVRDYRARWSPPVIITPGELLRSLRESLLEAAPPA